MFAVLKQIMDQGKTADFLIPGFPQPVRGTISNLSQAIAVVRTTQAGTDFEIIAHPDNVGVLQRV